MAKQSTLHLIDSTTNPNILKLLRWVSNAIPDTYWSQYRLHAFVIDSSSISHFLATMPSALSDFASLRLPFSYNATLEKLLLEILQDSIEDPDWPEWNKIKLSYSRELDRFSLITLWDEDWYWLNHIEVDDEFNLAYSANVEEMILSWEGLPTDVPRPSKLKHHNTLHGHPTDAGQWIFEQPLPLKRNRVS